MFSILGIGFIAGIVLWGIFIARGFKMEEQVKTLLIVTVIEILAISFCFPHEALVLAGTLGLGEVIGWGLSRIGYSP